MTEEKISPNYRKATYFFGYPLAIILGLVSLYYLGIFVAIIGFVLGKTIGSNVGEILIAKEKEEEF